MNLEQERDQLKKRARAYEEMLFRVLEEVGEPVIVSKDRMQEPFFNDKQIQIVEVEDGTAFSFSVGDVPDEL